MNIDKPSSPPTINRRSFLRTALYGLLGTSLTGLGGTYYCTRIEPSWLKTERIIVPIRNLPRSFEGYRIAQISDIHIYDDFSRQNAVRGVERALSLAADMIVFTGDYVSHFVHPSLFDSIKPLASHNNIWTILGNHDHWVDAPAIRDVVRAVGLPELRNAAVPLTRNGEQLWLAGVDDIWTEHHDLHAALADVPQDAPLILLAHEPDYADEVTPLGRVSLMLSGHSHGGQVTLPWIGSPVVPYLGQKYIRGLRQVGQMWLYTNRGVSNLTPIRFNCRPEVTEITLTRA